MFAAGVDLIPDEPPYGVGVRFREMKLLYTKNFRRDFDRRAVVWPLKFDGKPVECIIAEEVIEDYHKSNFSTDDEIAKALSDMMHVVLAAVEKRLSLLGYCERVEISHAEVGA